MMHLPQLEEEPIKLFMVIAITLIKLSGPEATLNLSKKKRHLTISGKSNQKLTLINFRLGFVFGQSLRRIHLIKRR